MDGGGGWTMRAYIIMEEERFETENRNFLADLLSQNDVRPCEGSC